MATALLVAGSTLTFWRPQFVCTSSYSSVVQLLGCSHNCRRLTYGSFQLTHMSRDDHAVQINWSSHGGPNEDRTLLQRSQRCHKGEFRHVSISARQRSLQCGQNLRVPFLRATLLDRTLERWRTTGRQRTHNSTTKVSFCTIIIHLCHCMIAITRV